MNYETMKQAGYEHMLTMGNGEHLLRNLESGVFEVWFCNKYHASYGIIFKNTHLEFAREEKQVSQCHWCKEVVWNDQWRTDFDGWPRCPYCKGN